MKSAFTPAHVCPSIYHEPPDYDKIEDAMYQKLQRNFDIIQFLFKNASAAQLAWRSEPTGWSLGEIICHLREVERAYLRCPLSELEGADSGWRLADSAIFREEVDYFRAFEDYSCYRRQTVELLQKAAPAQWNWVVNHEQFGPLTLSRLVEKMDRHDQFHIQQMEALIQQMPLNPLLARALHEISDYHRRYQIYLAGATSLLDIGVGTGLALRHIMQENPHLNFAGVDVRDLRLPEAQVPLQVYDGQTLPFSADQFDIALLFYVLHHCQQPGRLLDEARRVTCQKLLVIEEFDRPGVDLISLDLTERQNHRALGLPPDLPYQLFDQAELEAMFRERHLVELEQQALPSQTTRPVQKYLYVLRVA